MPDTALDPARFARDVLAPVARGARLDEDTAAAAMRAVVRGEVSAVRATAFALALSARGETVDELVGMARAVRDAGVPVPYDGDVVDTCGTGGDGLDTFNISTAAAVVAAAAGAVVAKHGNRASSSACGSADVLAELGVDVGAGPSEAARCLRDNGIAFLAAPTFHPGFRHVADARRELGARTAFNLLGPLCNPAAARAQVLGVPRAELVAPMAQVLHRLGVCRAMVVHAGDGMDELSLNAPSHVVELRDGHSTAYRLDPARWGLAPAPDGALRGGDARCNAAILRSVLDGEQGPRRNVVLLNAAAALYVAGVADDVGAGLALAAGRLRGWVRAGATGEAVPA